MRRRHGSQWKDNNGDGVMHRVVTSPHAHLVTGVLIGLDRLLGMWATVLGLVVSTPLVAGVTGRDATRSQASK